MSPNSKQKELGQVWTPLWAVRLVLDEAGFNDDSILGKRILEPSFGAGVFLKEIVTRIITTATSKGYSKETIVTLINDFVYGIEYDETTFKKTITELKEWAFQTYGLIIPFSHLYQLDALDFEKFGSFDFVVGNPPYVRVHNLPQGMRDKVKTYAHSTGTTDLYLIFYELGIKWLNDTGRLGYIAPNSWMRNASQKKFRTELVERELVSKITDFGKVNVFAGISAYTSIVVLDRNLVTDVIYTQMSTETVEEYKVAIPFSYLDKHKGEPFNFVSETDYSFIRDVFNKNNPLINDCYKIQNGILTLGDKFFILNEDTSNSIEKQFTRPVIKGTLYKGERVTKRIIFPYKLKNGKYVGLSEEELVNEAPNLNTHFNSIKTGLLKRSSDKGSLWFWYGRSQTIQETGKRKLVITPLIGPNQTRVKTNIVLAGTIVYSGLIATETHDTHSLEKLKETLESEEFARYCKLYGKDMSGNYKSISAPMVKNYPLNP